MSHGEKFGERMPELKTVKVTPETHRRLADIGRMLDSMDSVIVKLLDFWEQNHKQG